MLEARACPLPIESVAHLTHPYCFAYPTVCNTQTVGRSAVPTLRREYRSVMEADIHALPWRDRDHLARRRSLLTTSEHERQIIGYNIVTTEYVRSSLNLFMGHGEKLDRLRIKNPSWDRLNLPYRETGMRGFGLCPWWAFCISFQ